jgi:hypothetical protein
MYSAIRYLGVAGLFIASTAHSQASDLALLARSPTPFSHPIGPVETASPLAIPAERALLGRVEERARAAKPASFTDAPIDGSRALMGKWPSPLPVRAAVAKKWSSFSALARGEFVTSASGEAEFAAVQNPDGSSGAFVLSLGVCGTQGAVLFTRRSGTPLGVGRYRISEAADGADEVLALFLPGLPTRPTGVFRGQSGWLDVIAESDRFSTGRFQVDAIGFLTAEPQREDLRVNLTGSFWAIAGSSSVRLCEGAE